MSESTTLVETGIEHCTRLIMAFAHHLDHREFAKVAGLFADTAIWNRHEQDLVGPDEILAVLNSRPATQLERHVMTTVHVSPQSPGECSAVSYALIFRTSFDGDGVPLESNPAPVVGEFHDRFTLTEQGWRFAYRTSVPVFTRPADR